ncbi:MAG: HI0074 family nucleotidyltransferase substrate-binding subunit [Candidatus Melainabacteria bacterium]|jgi:nucleotidyltransferase substrate binding protein (TIGR01987 family)|nr:HI0074 family nucleotidyltransferase substrate-binding subunit [Candidatus Melainabacteria bacterium]
MLDFSSLDNAITQLEMSLTYANSDLAKTDINVALLFRSASIQAFEYTYELSHKFLKRYLEATDPSPQTIDVMNFQDLIRTGAEKGLLKNSWDVWQFYRKARGSTSHTYSEIAASKVFAMIPDFVEEVRFLRDKLVERLIE